MLGQYVHCHRRQHVWILTKIQLSENLKNLFFFFAFCCFDFFPFNFLFFNVPTIKERHVPIQMVQEMIRVPENNTKLDTKAANVTWEEAITFSMQRSEDFLRHDVVGAYHVIAR